MNNVGLPKLLSEGQLDVVSVDLEKEDCLRSLLGHLNAVGDGDVSDMLSTPRFQVVWRKACKVFDFYSGDTAKCSVSNIEAFHEMVAKTYPDMYKELSDTGKQAVGEIKTRAVATSNRILERNGPGEGFNVLHVGPVELLQMIGPDGFGESTYYTKMLFSFLNKEGISAYMPHFNQYIATHFTQEDNIRKFLQHGEGQRSVTISSYIDGSTTLLLLSRLRDWKGVLDNKSFKGYSTSTSQSRLAEMVPQEFLKLIQTRGNKEEIRNLGNTIMTLIQDPSTLEDNVFPVALILLEIEKQNEQRESTSGFYHSDPFTSSRSDAIHSILAERFPERYVAMLKEHGLKVSLDDPTTQQLHTPMTDKSFMFSATEVISALRSTTKDSNQRERRRVWDILIQAGVGTKVVDLVVPLDIKKGDLYEYDFVALAQACSRELAQKIRSSEALPNSFGRDICKNPLQYADILGACIAGGAGEDVLAIIENVDYGDIDIYIHALLWKHLPDTYREIAKRKGFEYERILRKLKHFTEDNLEKIINGIIHDYRVCDVRETYNSHQKWLAERGTV